MLGVPAGSRLAPRGCSPEGEKLLQQTTKLTWCSHEVGLTAGEGQDSTPSPTNTDSWLKPFMMSQWCRDQACSWVLNASTGGQSRSHMEGIKTQEHFYIICDFSTNYPLHSYKQLWLEEVNLFFFFFFLFFNGCQTAGWTNTQLRKDLWKRINKFSSVNGSCSSIARIRKFREQMTEVTMRWAGKVLTLERKKRLFIQWSYCSCA